VAGWELFLIALQCCGPYSADPWAPGLSSLSPALIVIFLTGSAGWITLYTFRWMELHRIALYHRGRPVWVPSIVHHQRGGLPWPE
jgi:hypothetical protein